MTGNPCPLAASSLCAWNSNSSTGAALLSCQRYGKSDGSPNLPKDMNQQQPNASEETRENGSHASWATAEGLSDVPAVCATLRVHRLTQSKQTRELSSPPHYEFKRDVFPELVALEPSRDSAKVRGIVEGLGLQIVEGKIPLQDLRIEHENPDGKMARVDLGLPTEHHRSRNLTEKVRAVFCIDMRSQDAGGPRRVLDQRELTAGILSR